MRTVKRKTNTFKTDGRRVRHHAPATSFRGMAEQNRRLFLKAKELLKCCGFNGDAYAFGSRVAGCWNDQSDLDIMICVTDKAAFLEILGKAQALDVDGLRIDLQPGRRTIKSDRFLISDRMSK